MYFLFATYRDFPIDWVVLLLLGKELLRNVNRDFNISSSNSISITERGPLIECSNPISQYQV
jgi:hypothetical protein